MKIARHMATFIKKLNDKCPIVLLTGPYGYGKKSLVYDITSPEVKTLSLANFFHVKDYDFGSSSETNPAKYLMITDAHFAPLVLLEAVRHVVVYNEKMIFFITANSTLDLAHYLASTDEDDEEYERYSQGDHSNDSNEESTDREAAEEARIYYHNEYGKLELSHVVREFTVLGFSLRELDHQTYDVPFLPTHDFIKERKTISPSTPHKMWERLIRGSAPALVDDPTLDRDEYYSKFLRNFISAELPELIKVEDQTVFFSFLVELAKKSGFVINLGEISSLLGVHCRLYNSFKRVYRAQLNTWLDVLVRAKIVYRLERYRLEDDNKEYSPKVYFLDLGLLCHLRGIQNVETILAKQSDMPTPLFEGYMISEILKSYYNRGIEPKVYHYRESNISRIDLIIENENGLYPIEFRPVVEPTLNDIRHFRTFADTFPNKKVNPGVIICLAKELLEMDGKNFGLPFTWI
jgi:predicted AAA+ superfamily ATPase